MPPLSNELTTESQKWVKADFFIPKMLIDHSSCAAFFWLSYFGHDDSPNEGTVTARFWAFSQSRKIVGTVKNR